MYGDKYDRNNRAAHDGVRIARLAFSSQTALSVALTLQRRSLNLLIASIRANLRQLLFGILVPLVALTYVWTTMGGRKQATLGMRAMGIRLERLDGGPVDGMLAVVHSVAFWAFNAVLTPLILLTTLFLEYKQTLHDRLLGTVVVRTDRDL
ncbi:MAG: RDD family protein [Brucellaceae bacterium]|nr:RDD family protein [Brucellaceae bacterium]